MDITKCFGEGCCLKNKCLRFTAPDGFMQSYAHFCKQYNYCDYYDFIPNEEAKKKIAEREKK